MSTNNFSQKTIGRLGVISAIILCVLSMAMPATANDEKECPDDFPREDEIRPGTAENRVAQTASEETPLNRGSGRVEDS